MQALMKEERRYSYVCRMDRGQDLGVQTRKKRSSEENLRAAGRLEFCTGARFSRANTHGPGCTLVPH